MKKYIAVGFVIVAVIAFNFGSIIHFVKAEIASFSPDNCYTASATTSLAYLSFGKGTSTVSCNLGNEGAISATVSVEVNASSTRTMYTFFPEESMNGIDWFPVNMRSFALTGTSSNVLLNADGSSTYTFASSTIGGIGIDVGLLGASTTGSGPTNNRNHFEFDIPMKMKRARVVASLASSTVAGAGISNQNGAVWMQIIPRQAVN